MADDTGGARREWLLDGLRARLAREGYRTEGLPPWTVDGWALCGTKLGEVGRGRFCRLVFAGPLAGAAAWTGVVLNGHHWPDAEALPAAVRAWVEGRVKARMARLLEERRP